MHDIPCWRSANVVRSSWFHVLTCVLMKGRIIISASLTKHGPDQLLKMSDFQKYEDCCSVDPIYQWSSVSRHISPTGAAAKAGLTQLGSTVRCAPKFAMARPCVALVKHAPLVSLERQFGVKSASFQLSVSHEVELCAILGSRRVGHRQSKDLAQQPIPGHS